MDAVVVYESMFGDNQQVALVVVDGLTRGGVRARAVEVGAAPTSISGEVDLLVVGSPNHGWIMPRPATRKDAATKTDSPLVSQGIGVREWLATVTLVPGVRTAAFDTRGSHPKAVVAFDRASSQIEKALVALGGVPVAPAEHFLVAGVTGPLEPGELDRARTWGRALAAHLIR